MNRRLSVSAVSSWTWALDDDLRFWDHAGIDHVGLSFRKLEEASLSVAVGRVRDAGLRVSNLVELGWFQLDEPVSWAAQQERLASALEAGETLGASCLVLTTGPAGSLDWPEAATALGAALEPTAKEARRRGVVLAIENTSPLRLDLSFTTTLRDTVDLARQLDAGVCLEVNSCFAERGFPQTIVDSTDVLAHVQVNDFIIGSLSTPDRAVPGDGDIPLRRILGSVLATGYPGAFELEIVGPRIEAEGYAGAIRRSVDHLDSLLDELTAADA